MCAESDPAHDSAVMWTGTWRGRGGEQRLDWLSLMWPDMVPGRCSGGVRLDQSPLLFLPPLYLPLSHMHARKHLQSVPFTAVFPALSILSVPPCCHPLPSLLNSFLSIHYSPLSHFPSRCCSIWLSQRAVSLSRSAEQRAWVRLHASLQRTDKNKASVLLLLQGEERVEMERNETERHDGEK